MSVSTPPIMQMLKLEIRRSLWRKLIRQLHHRGGEVRESGAFLLGARAGNCIEHFIPYDDLDPKALSTGIVSFHGEGFIPLWDYCLDHKMQVLADVHTHGDQWTGQSETDRTNPMIEQAGHIALILPHFAASNRWSLRGVGIYEYQGDHDWKKWAIRSGRVRLTGL
jgi:proteasome lid subunit RPN8/RPN11